MKIKKVKIGKTFNLGNFESVHIELQAEISDQEDHFNVLGDLKKDIENFYKLEMI